MPDLLVSLSQVLGEVFNCLYRAQLGQAAESVPDPQLPEVVRVPRQGAASGGSMIPAVGVAAAGSPGQTPLALPKGEAGLANGTSAAQVSDVSMVQDVFGLKVQVRTGTQPAMDAHACPRLSGSGPLHAGPI